MELEVTHEQSSDSWRVKLRGEVDLDASWALRTELLSVIESGARVVIVDLSETTFMDSTALGVLLAVRKRLRREAKLSIVCADQTLMRMFEVTGMDRVFRIHATVEAALTVSAEALPLRDGRRDGWLVVEEAGEGARSLMSWTQEKRRGTNMDERERRIGLNEALFREVNEAVESVSDELDVPAFEVICECGTLTCTQRIQITSRQYAELRSESDEFAVVPGHELPDVEEVVAKKGNYNVVKKSGPAARKLAEQTDPRTG